MKRLLLCLLFVVICSVARADVQLLPAWERLTPSSVKGASYSGGLYAAKGETESFQLAVFAPKGSYAVTWSAPPGIAVKAYSEQWTKAAAKAPYWFPDGLLPLAREYTLNIADFKPGAVWFDVQPARTVAAGSYKINVKVGATTRVITLTVWNFSLPEKPRLKSAIGLFPPTRGELGAELLLLEHRLMPTFIDATHKTALNAAGQTQAHIGGYASMSGTRVTTAAPSAATVDAWVAKYAPLSAYSYLQDEEYDATALANLQTYSRNMAGKVKRMVTTKITPASAWLEIVCAMPKFLNDSLIAGRLAKGKETWMYQTLSQDTYTPKWLLHYNYANWVMMPWLSYRYKTTGLLMWRADYEKSGFNPWTKADAYGTSYPGEASWILPLKEGQPASSFTGATGYAPTIRLKWLRDGVDTYDYLMMLQDHGQGAFAMETARTVAASFSTWSKDPVAIETARRKLGAKLSGS